MGLEPLSVLCVCLFTLLNMNISVTRLPITIKFYLKHRLVGEGLHLVFCAYRIRTLVSMAIDTSRTFVMWKIVSSGFFKYFYKSFFILKGNDDMHKGLNEFKIRSDRAMDYRVSCP